MGAQLLYVAQPVGSCHQEASAVEEGGLRSLLADRKTVKTAHLAMEDVAVVVPTLNAGHHAAALVAALCAQDLDLGRIVVIDSQSDDGSTDIFRHAGFVVHVIERDMFDHGATRNLGLEMSHPSEIVLFLTQDSLPSGPEMLRSMLAPFSDPRVGLVYGRQVPRDGAGEIETHARQFNYPTRSAIRALPAARALGIKAVFNSNSCAAYRRSALQAVGGFPSRIIMGEDQVAAARLLQAGWTVVYEAEALVKHSHGYTVSQEFARYFDIGVFHEQQRNLLAPFGPARSEGWRFVASELRHLLHTTPLRIPEAMLRTVAKLSGYKLGLRHRALPLPAKRLLTMNKRYFSR